AMLCAWECKKARYNLCKSIRKAKRDYSLWLEGYYTTADSRRMWQGLQHITEYRQRSQGDITPNITLPDELNEFYARFEAPNTGQQHKTLASEGIMDRPLTVSSAEVCMALKKTNLRKAAGPDNIPWRALLVCTSELANVFMDIYNLSLTQALVPTCFKSTTSIPLPKKNTVTCLNDYCPIALTPIAMKCFESIVMSHIKRTIPTTLDPFQFAYLQNWSTEDVVNAAIHTALTHLEGKDTYYNQTRSYAPSRFSSRVLKVFLSRTAQRIPYITSWKVLCLLCIILLIVLWFLVAWTLAVCQNQDWHLALITVGFTPEGLQFSMCLLDRWDYMMAVAEFLFLLWSVYLCYGVRTVPSAFHEPRYMTIAVHNELIISAIFHVISNICDKVDKRNLDKQIYKKKSCNADMAKEMIWDGIGQVISGAWFPPDMTLATQAKEFKVVLCFIRPENFVSYGLRVLQVGVEDLECPSQSPDSDSASLNTFGMNWNWSLLNILASVSDLTLFNRVLESERMPEEWRRSVLVPIFKNKGDVQSCSNYRGIKLMSHTMKLWERLVEARLRKVVEICEQQYGFMPRKSTTDAIFALRILMEKYRDGQRELHCVFVDLEKAYDRVPREELWYCMRKSGVAEKYVRVVQDMYERSRTVVRCAVGQTEEFKVEVGLHQGSALSPFLFAIVMDQLSEEVRQESPWTMMFADDIVICSESREQVEENLERWRFALERRGMKVSHSKTEYMCVNEREGSGTVRLQGEEVKKVQEFKYLGSTVQSNGECGKEVKKRVQAGWNGWRKVSGVLCDRKISARIKGKVYRTVVRPAMLYGLETVSLRKRQESELEVAELKMLRFTFASELHPDWMLMLFFAHTHLTVTVTLGLLLFPKFLFAGTHLRDDIATEAYEDELDMGRSGSYLNSSITSAWSEHSLDPEDIREELKKLYSQLEIYKRKKMLANNPHLQKKRSSKKGLGRSLMRRITEIPETMGRQHSREDKELGEHGSNCNSICVLRKNPFEPSHSTKPAKEESLKNKVFSLKKSHSSYDHVRDQSEDSSSSATDKMEVSTTEGSLLETLMGKKLVKKKSSEKMDVASESTESVPLVCKSASAHNLTADKKPLHPRTSMLQKSLSVIASAKERTLGLTGKTQSIEDPNKNVQQKNKDAKSPVENEEAYTKMIISQSVEYKQTAGKAGIMKHQVSESQPAICSERAKGKDVYNISEVCPWELEDLPTPSENRVQKHVSIAAEESTTIHSNSTKAAKQQKQKGMDQSPSSTRRSNQKPVDRADVCSWEDGSKENQGQTDRPKPNFSSQLAQSQIHTSTDRTKSQKVDVCPWEFDELPKKTIDSTCSIDQGGTKTSSAEVKTKSSTVAMDVKGKGAFLTEGKVKDVLPEAYKSSGSSLQASSKADICPWDYESTSPTTEKIPSASQVSKTKETMTTKKGTAPVRTFQKEKEKTKGTDDEKARTKSKDKPPSGKPTERPLSQAKLSEICPWDVDSGHDTGDMEKQKSPIMAIGKTMQAAIRPWDFEDPAMTKDVTRNTDSSIAKQKSPSSKGVPGGAKMAE
ncbi:hypothetical protein QTP86_034561, partial [Hemibagrus guttatus]